MTSTDKEGVLDKYFYTYDNSGYISEINRNRRELDAVSGKYEYSYDAIGRLTKSTHDGAIKAEYQYDAFGNRTSLTEGNTSTKYSYDVLDRLLEVNELNNNQSVVKTYDYDKRGNQTNEYVDGVLNKTFTFDATGMMSKVTDAVKGQQENLYNGLGFRVETTRPEEHIEYLCDLSKDYFNLLERTINGEKESFVYDKNVISMSKKGSNFYYLQDELGSPMYLTGTDGVAVSSYAFDDFGRNIDPRTGKQKHGYTKDGNIIQPFAFTGYQEDEFSGLKFAQARFYDARVGRFESRDKVKGFTHAPFTLNNYSYCFNNPLGLVDRDGNLPEWVSDACDVASGAWDATCEGVGAAWDATSTGVSKAWDATCDGIGTAWNATSAGVSKVWDTTCKSVSKAYNTAIEGVGTAWDSTCKYINKAATNTYETVTDAFVSMGNGIEDLYNSASVWLDENKTWLESFKRPIIVIGGSGSAGAELYLSGGEQVVIDPLKLFTDPLHMIGSQNVYGAGGQAGASADLSGYIGVYWAEDISWTEGFGTEIGGSGGEGAILGGGLWVSGEADDPQNRYGAFLSLGIGAEGTIVEGHVAMAETTPTFYPLEFYYNLIKGLFNGECVE